jgi:hypothetical protein
VHQPYQLRKIIGMVIEEIHILGRFDAIHVDKFNILVIVLAPLSGQSTFTKLLEAAKFDNPRTWN